MARGKCCAAIHLKEDNARFVLLILSLLVYMLIGAEIFSLIEHDQELLDRKSFNATMEEFKAKYGHLINDSELTKILKVYSEADKKGFLATKRDRWDFSGAFYFVCTVISTIGFGMTSPTTPLGKVSLIIYGLPGCAACILFYNLFLERLITFLAFIMKKCHERKVRREKNQNGLPNLARRPSQQSDDNLDNWKPSVYYVLLYLCIASTIIACVASAMYAPIEEWDYGDSIYFCFVAFSTIGFGDLVTSQKKMYDQQILYRFGNFVFLTAGVCCIYSLYNVVSIVIKQLLNWVLKKLECRCCHRRKPRPRRNAITPGHLQRQVNSANKQQQQQQQQANGVDITDVDSNYDSETDGRRMSGEMISMKDFLAANKVSLAVMQKQLYETSQHRKHHASSNGAFGQGVGGLAMLNNKLQETERRD